MNSQEARVLVESPYKKEVRLTALDEGALQRFRMELEIGFRTRAISDLQQNFAIVHYGIQIDLENYDKKNLKLIRFAKNGRREEYVLFDGSNPIYPELDTAGGTAAAPLRLLSFYLGGKRLQIVLDETVNHYYQTEVKDLQIYRNAFYMPLGNAPRAQVEGAERTKFCTRMREIGRYCSVSDQAFERIGNGGKVAAFLVLSEEQSLPKFSYIPAEGELHDWGTSIKVVGDSSSGFFITVDTNVADENGHNTFLFQVQKNSTGKGYSLTGVGARNHRDIVFESGYLRTDSSPRWFSREMGVSSAQDFFATVRLAIFVRRNNWSHRLMRVQS